MNLFFNRKPAIVPALPQSDKEGVGLFTIYDRVAQRHTAPFTAPNTETAKRVVRGACNGGDRNMSEHPQDYDLYQVGFFNDTSGEVTGEGGSTHVCTVSSLRVPA